MNNPDNIKIMAKSKMKLSAALVLMLVLMGAVTEYARLSRPLAQAVVVLVPQGEKALAASGVESAVQAVEEQRKAVSAEAFVHQLQEISQQAASVQKPESALGQIVLPKQQVEETTVSEEEARERVIEVYDEAGEPVEIIEVSGEAVAEEVPAEEPEIEYVSSVAEVVENVPVAVEESVAPEALGGEAPVEAVAESAETVESSPQDVVNTEENISSENANDGEMPEIDMMKDIIAREQAAAEGN